MITQFTAKQKQVALTPPKRWNFLGGAVRSGKTFITYWIWLSELQNSNGPYLLTGRTLGSLRRNVLNPMRELFGEEVVSEIRSNNSTVKIAGKTHDIICATDDRAVEKLQGSSFERAYGDEIPTWPESFFNMLKSRLDKRTSRFWGTYNPDHPYHWFKKNVIDVFNSKTTNLFDFHLDDNTFLDPEVVEALKSEYTGVWYDRYIRGMWTAAEGVVFSAFKDENVYDEDVADDDVIFKVGTFDYGTQNDFVMLIVAFCVDGRYRVTHEYRWSGRETNHQKTDAEYVDECEKFLNDNHITLAECVVDPSATNFILALNRKLNIKVKAANNEVLPGIQRVNSMLYKGQLLIHRRCTGLIKEMYSYVWNNKAGNSTGIDTPTKSNDHGCDALRYFVNTIAKIFRVKGF